MAKVFHADPLTCRKCGGKLKIVAYLHDQVAIKQVLAHLGLSPPEEPKPPPAVHEVVRVPVVVITPRRRLLKPPTAASPSGLQKEMSIGLVRQTPQAHALGRGSVPPGRDPRRGGRT